MLLVDQREGLPVNENSDSNNSHQITNSGKMAGK